MRMLKIPELLKIQGFPENYKLKGTKTEQKKYIGNAVVPLVAKAIIKEKSNVLQEYLQKAI
jgi:DNA (cytosine-5)-methyltransferase 1